MILVWVLVVAGNAALAFVDPVTRPLAVFVVVVCGFKVISDLLDGERL